MNSATIVSAALDSSQLETSINALVKMVDEKAKAMAKSFTDEVARMEQAVKNLGSIKIDSGGTADGGSSRRTKMLSEESLKAKEVTMTYDQMQAALQKIVKDNSGLKDIRTFNKEELQSYVDLLRKLQAEYVKVNTQEGGGAKSDQIKRDMAELEKIIQGYQTILTNVEAINSRQGTIDVKKWTQDIGAVDDRYKKLVRWYTVLEKEDQRRIANEEKANAKRLAEIDKEQKAREKMTESARKAEEKYQNAVLKTAFNKIVDLPSNNIDQMRTKLERLQTILANIRELGILSPKEIANAETEIGNLRGNIQQIEKLEKERIAAEKQFIVEQAKEIEQTQTLEGRIKSLAQIARERLKETQSGYTDLQAYGKAFRVFDTSSSFSKGLSIEEQIKNALTEEKTAREGVSQAAQQQANSTQNVAKANQEESETIRKNFRDYDSLRQAIASVLGIKSENVRLQGVEISSINDLSNRLKQLRSVYNQLGTQDRGSERGKELIRQIQVIERQMDRARKELSRPIDLKNAFSLSEKTLDDIAYKMRQLASYKMGLNIKDPKAMEEMEQVDAKITRLKKQYDDLMSKNSQMINSNNALGRSWNYMKNRLAFYFSVGASTQFIKNLIEVRSQYEMNERALGILINSAERGTQIFNELSQMALVSPYTLIELSAAAKQLTAYDIAARDVVDTTRRLADMAAAVGIPIERLTYALGQIKAYGYLNARDARMFANAGIPLVKQLSEYYTELEGHLVSTADIYDRIKKKSIGYEEVISVIARMTDEGGKFYDFQAKMAETLKVQLANLTLAWNNMLNAMGEESQGVLVGGINALKQMFLHWKDIEHILYEIVVALGAYKAYQIITTRLMGATSAALDSQILAMKRNNAAMLEKQALTRKLTVEEARLIATQKQVTASDYMNALSGKQLTKQKALMLVALNKNNVALKSAIVNMGLLTTAEVNSITAGKAFAIVLKSIGISIRTAALAVKSFVVSMMPLLAIGAIYELYHAWDSYGEHVKEVNKQAAENAKEAFQNIKEYLQGDVTSALQDRLEKGGKVENEATGQKSWDEMREKIELSSIASNAFIAKLMQINDINQRLSAGFKYLESVQKVAGVMQTLEEDAVKVSSTSLGGLFGEGLKDDLVDFINAYQKYVSLNENLRKSGVGENYFNEQKKALEEFRGEVEKTTTSLYNIASKEGFNTNEQREFFEREISEIAQAEQMGAKETRIFRMQAEKEYYAYARAQLVAQLEYQQGAQKAATEKRIKDLDNEFGTNKALQESFFTWLTEKQDHAVKNMLRGKTQEEIKQGEWLKGSNAKWVEEMARKFSKEYGVSFDDLHRLVLNANTWSINIPVFFQTIGQPLSDVQRDYEARTGKKFSNNPLIKDAKTQVEILDILKKKQNDVANEMATAEKAGGQYWEANKKRLQEQNDALVADIHAYNALTDAEEKAQKKSGSKGSKKDTLLDALKQEISLVEKLQSDYDNLAKSGASQADALDTIRVAYGKTIRLLNTQLSGFGLPQINISELITGKDPNKALAHFKQTLNTLVSKGMLTLERSKELEAVIEKFTLSAKTYNLDKITKGLNNELDRLKEEYELALELDANPELGDMFADMFGIDTSTLPQTFGDALDRAQIIINRKLAEMKISTPFDLMQSNVDDFAKSTGLSKESSIIKELVSAQNAYRDMFKKNITETEKVLDDYIKKYGDYSDKIAEIEADRLEKLKKLNEAYYTEEMRKRPEYIAKMNAINQGASREKSNVEFDAFKNSRYYTMMFENLDYISTKTIRDMRDRLRELMDSMKDLKPEQLKQVMSQYEKLEQKLVKRSPFKTLTKDLKNYLKTSGDRKAANEAFRNAQKEYDAQEKNVAALKEKYEQAKANNNTSQSYLDFLQIEIDGESQVLQILKEQLEIAEKKADKYNLTAKLAKSEALQVAQVVAANLKGLAELRDQMNELFGVDASKGETLLGHQIDGLIDGLAKASDGISKVTSSAQSGNVFGVVGGVVDVFTGIGDGIASLFGDGSARTKRLNREINESREAVRQLSMAYDDLERAINKSLGTGETEARRLAIANKEAQLAELERQKELEQSKRSKDRDDDAIKQYEETIHSLRNEIDDLKEEVINNLWGEEVKSAAEAFVDAWVQAWRAGETTLDAIQEKMDEMIYNLIKKAMTSKIVETLLNPIYKELDRMTKEGSEGGVALTTNELRQLAQQAGITAGEINTALGEFYGNLEQLGIVSKTEDKSSELSALQQGLQSMSESTANALEAYANSISQQAYLRNDLLVQIRDTIMSFDMDVQLGVFSQMLLQLQNNYIVMQSMQSMMEGWTTPSGQGIRVELIS